MTYEEFDKIFDIWRDIRDIKKDIEWTVSLKEKINKYDRSCLRADHVREIMCVSNDIEEKIFQYSVSILNIYEKTLRQTLEELEREFNNI